MSDTAGYALAIAGAVFVAFLVVRTVVWSEAVRPIAPELRKRLEALKVKARDRNMPANERAAAWRDAAKLALDDIKRPRLAASFAMRALRLNVEDAEGLDLLVRALRRARRWVALEREIWRRIPMVSGALREHLVNELIELYDGPMKRRERARGLRALVGRPLEP